MTSSPSKLNINQCIALFVMLRLVQTLPTPGGSSFGGVFRLPRFIAHLCIYLCIYLSMHLSICIYLCVFSFSADSSSKYAFAGQDKEEQKREELVDFVRYLAFLNFVRNSTLSSSSTPNYSPTRLTKMYEMKN